MGLFDDWKKIAILAVTAIFGIAIMNNQIYFSVFLGSVAFVALVIYLYYNRPKKMVRPLEMLREGLLRRANQPGTPLMWLVLTGGKDKRRYYGKVTLGKLKGWTHVHLKFVKNADGSYNPWSDLYIFRYVHRAPGLIGALTYLVFQLPLLSMFRKPDSLFACNNEQLGSNSTTGGNIEVLGTSIDTVGLFDMLSTPDLDKDMVFYHLGDEVSRITLAAFFDELPDLMYEAVRSSPSHLKGMEILHGIKPDFNIKS